MGTFGRCWHPAVATDWRPYCNGTWEWTDCGWYWVSDEPWAWACYHYGSRAFDPNDGWVWIPGIEWAPAWVNWRTGGDYVGWAPCGPSGVTIDASYYVFIQSQHFNDAIRPDNIVANNASILGRTSEIRNVGREQRQIGGRSQTVVVNNGPDLAMVEKTTGHKFTAVSVEKADQSTLHSIPDQVKRQSAKPDEQRARSSRIFVNHSGPLRNCPNNGRLRNCPGQILVEARNCRIAFSPDKNYRPIGTSHLRGPCRGRHRIAPAHKRRLHRMVPPVNSEPPGGKGLQSPKEIIPPAQVPPRQPAPVAPGNGVPVEKGKDSDHN